MDGTPAALLEIVRDVVAAEKEIDRQVEQAIEQWEAHSQYSEFVQSMVRARVQEVVYQQRGVNNVRFKHPPIGPAKVGVGVVNQVAMLSVLDMVLGGRPLASYFGKELKGLAEHESNLARGHSRNANFVRSLSALVPDEKQVSDVVSAARARTLWNRTSGDAGDQASATEKNVAARHKNTNGHAKHHLPSQAAVRGRSSNQKAKVPA